MTMHLDASDFAALDEPQRIAVLETMVVALIADTKVTPSEIRRFDEIVLGLPWGVEREVLGAMVRSARDRLVALKTQPEVLEYVGKLAKLLPDQMLREKLIFTMATLFHSDGELANQEKAILGLFAITFEIKPDRVNVIREALHLPPLPADTKLLLN